MSGEMFDRRRTPGTDENRLREALQNLSNAFQAEILRHDGPIARATLDLLNYATDPNQVHSEYARSGISFRLAAGTLLEQKERLRLQDPARDAINDLLTEAHSIFQGLQAHPNLQYDPNLQYELCSYLIRPALPEEERFATRELLEIHAGKAGKDRMVKDSMLLAESLVTFERPQRPDSQQIRLDEIATLTQQPSLWVIVLDNITDGRIHEANRKALTECLRMNLAQLREDPIVQGRLAALAHDTGPLSSIMFAGLCN